MNRSFKTLCPSCGAQVEFRSGDSVIVVCPYCTSTLLRKDDSIERIGRMADLFDDHSPLQLGAQGTADGRGFGLIGRLQYRYPAGVWNEWRLLFDDGRTGWLSEDNGQYVLLDDGEVSAPAALTQIPPFEALSIDQPLTAAGVDYRVAGKQVATVIAGEGELPFRVGAGYPAYVADLRGPRGEFATLDYRGTEVATEGGAESADTARLYVGHAVTLAALDLNGLRTDFSKQVATEPFECPACGGPVQAILAQSRTLTCAACASVIDLSQGVGKRLDFFRQAKPRSLRIPLQSVCTFDGARWTVVGYQERGGEVEGEKFVWEEFLLHEPMKGFRFLVHDNGHWTWMELVQRSFRRSAAAFGRKVVESGGKRFDLYSTYPASVNHVAGEFYWQVVQGETSRNEDYIAPPETLSREETDAEVTWSHGRYLTSGEVGKAFGLKRALPAPRSLGMIQPAPRSWRRAYVRLSLVAFVALCLIQGWFMATGGSGELVASRSLSFDPSRSADHLVEVTGARPANLIVSTAADLTNDSYVLHVDVASRDQAPPPGGQRAQGGSTGGFDPGRPPGLQRQASRDVGFWEGRDSDGYWSEGSRSERVVFKVPPGKYLLRISAERSLGPPGPRASYRVEQSSRPTWLPFLAGVLGLFVLNVVGVFSAADPEAERWRESLFGTRPGRPPSG